MPPKKKNRQPAGVEETENAPQTPTKSRSDPDDPWTDDQEALLFKSMLSLKPVGMHKHFRVMAISENLRSHGYSAPQDAHTYPAGIWEKLRTLYDLDALDEIENTTSLGTRLEDQEAFCDFELPDEEYWTMIFGRRLAPKQPSSPPELPHQLDGEVSFVGRRQSTADDTDETPSPASNRGGRGTRGRGNRASQLAEAARKKRRGSRLSIGESADDADAMDVDAEAFPKSSKGGMTGNARRSGRKR